MSVFYDSEKIIHAFNRLKDLYGKQPFVDIYGTDFCCNDLLANFDFIETSRKVLTEETLQQGVSVNYYCILRSQWSTKHSENLIFDFKKSDCQSILTNEY